MSSDTNIWETGVNANGNGTDNNQYFISDTSDAEKRLTIQRGTGNIGIGTNEPSQLLDVSGNINLSGNIYLSNTGTIYKNDIEYAGGSVSYPLTGADIFEIDTQYTTTEGDYRLLFMNNGATILNSSSSIDLRIANSSKLSLNNTDIISQVNINCPSITFSDGSQITTAPSSGFSGNYNDLINIPFTPTFLKVYFLMDYAAIMTQLTEPGAIAPYFNTDNIPINVGSFTVSNSGISVPANGYYHIDYCLLMRSKGDGYERKNIITSIKVNNADPDGRLQGVGGSYIRSPAASINCENAQGGNTMLYLQTSDVVSLWGYREGNTGDVFITRAGNMQVRRIA